VQEFLIVGSRLVAGDIGKAKVNQHGADVRVLELDRLFAAVIKHLREFSPVRRLVVPDTRQFGTQHGEVIGSARLYLCAGPVSGHLSLCCELSRNTEQV
jgi:hypothetical protein